MNKFEIITASTSDAEIIASIGSQGFAETFVGLGYYTREIVDGYNEKAFELTKLRGEILDPNASFFLLKIDGDVAGYAKLIEREPPECIKDLNAICLERIYLLKAFHAKGVGSKLLDHCFKIARAKGYEHLWLSVWEHNVNAVAWYDKRGFTQAGTWEWPFESQGIKYVDIDMIYFKKLS